MDANVINTIINEQKTSARNRVYCVKCKVFVTREDRENMCDFECLSGSCNKKLSQLVPSYRKCYTVYQYDREKYSRIYKKLQKAAIKLNDASIFYRVSPYRILDLCYIRDEDGNPKNLWFEHHAHRRAALDRIKEELARHILLGYNNNPTEEDLKNLFIKTGVAVFIRQDYNQAELYDLMYSDIKDQVHNYFLLLRYLRCGCTVEEGMRYVNISIHKSRAFEPRDYTPYVDEMTFLDKPSDEVGEPIEPKPYVTINSFRNDMRLLDFFQDMTDKYTAFNKKDIKKDFCKTFNTSENFFYNRWDDILEEATEQATLVGLKIFCDRRLFYLAFEPYKEKFMDMFVKDKREGLI